MSYVTQQHLIDRVGEDSLISLTDRAATGSIDTAVLNRVIGDTDALIDGFVKKRYALPLATVPPLLTGLAADIALYLLHNFSAPDDVRRRYDDALARLKDISDGRIALDVGGDAPAAEPSLAEFTGPDRVFSRDKMTGW